MSITSPDEDVGMHSVSSSSSHEPSSSSSSSTNESMKLHLSESVAVCGSLSSSVDNDEAESPSLVSKRSLIHFSDSSDVESKKMKLTDGANENRRESIAVIKVIENENKSDVGDRSVIDLISDKESSINPDNTGDIKASEELDLFTDSQHDSESFKAKTSEEENKTSIIGAPMLEHCVTPVTEPPKSMTNSVEFNEKETYSSTPNYPNQIVTSNPIEKQKSDINPSEKATNELPKEPVYFIQLMDISILKGIRNKFGVGPVYQASHAPDPHFLKEALDWKKLELKDLGLVAKSGRVSDASSLSTISSKVSSLGYNADQSSGGSGLSENGKRDRMSIAPDTAISPHKVIAKLPDFKTTPKVILEDLTPVSVGNKLKLDTLSKKKTLRKKRVKKLETVSPPGTENIEEANDSSDPIDVGVNVFAKWTEGKRKARYYFGKIVERVCSDKEKKWKIEFSDGISKILKESDLILCASLVPGTSVNVVDDGNNIRRAIILSHPIPTEEGPSYSLEYEVVDDEPVEESFLALISKIHLNIDQALAVTIERGGVPKESTPSVTGGDLNLDNIVSTKRVRSSRLHMTPAKSVKRGGKYVDTSAAETSCSETPKSVGVSRKKAVKSRVVPSTTETENDECSSPSVRKKGSRNKRDDSGNLFHSMCFILTKTLNKCHVMGIDTETDVGDSSSASSSDENEDQKEKISSNFFNKSEVKSLILKHGGTVLNSFPGEMNKFPKKENEFYILSDKSCRTLNFLYGIAHGVTRISYQWVLDSAREVKKFPVSNYLLPVGYSEILGMEIEQRTRESKPLTSMLNNVRILVLGETTEDWKSFLVRLGAKVFSHEKNNTNTLSKKVLSNVDVVLVTDDDGFVQSHEELKNNSVVSPRWIIQSLINGKKLGTDFFLIK